MFPTAPQFAVRLGAGPDDARAAARLRYAVFVQEMGGDGPLVDHPAREERDRFDPFCQHLLLEDLTRPSDQRVVGLYRLMGPDAASAGPGFYSASEFDLTALTRSSRRLLELGRSCLHRDYRGGTAMFHLWQGLSDHVTATATDLLFGVASFPGTDAANLAQPLSLLYHRHRAPPALQALSRRPQRMDLVAEAALNPLAALRAMPALIKAYLRLGGMVGADAFVDADFRTIDVCLVLDTTRLNARTAAIYRRPRPGPA